MNSGHRYGVAEERGDRIHVDHTAALEAEPRRVLHPRVHRQDHERARDPRDGDRNAAQEVQSRRQPVPAVDVDRDEDRLDEERDALEREPQAEHRSEPGHEARPQQPHLEAENRPGHHAHSEQREHRLRPALGELPIERVARAQVKPLDQEDKRRERDPEAHDRDVHRERERLHLTRLQEVLLVHGSDVRGEERQHARSDHRHRYPRSIGSLRATGCPRPARYPRARSRP